MNTFARGVATLGACGGTRVGVKVAEVGSTRNCCFRTASPPDAGAGWACGSGEKPGGTDGVEVRVGNSMLSATSASTDAASSDGRSWSSDRRQWVSIQ
jgi:hypothetical protein